MAQGQLTRPDGVHPPVRVAVHDCELVVRGLEVILEPHAERIVLVDPRRPRAVDLHLLDPFASDALSSAVERAEPDVAIVLFTWLAGDELGRWAHAPGVVGHVLKSATANHLVQTLEAIALVRGGRPGADEGATGDDLSGRERQILDLVGRGLSNREIADELFVSINTVKTYIRGAYRKIGVQRRSQAVAWAVSEGG